MSEKKNFVQKMYDLQNTLNAKTDLGKKKGASI